MRCKECKSELFYVEKSQNVEGDCFVYCDGCRSCIALITTEEREYFDQLEADDK